MQRRCTACAVEGGKWAVDRTMGSGQRSVGSGHWAVDSIQWALGSQQMVVSGNMCPVDTGNGQWAMGSGKKDCRNFLNSVVVDSRQQAVNSGQ